MKRRAKGLPDEDEEGGDDDEGGDSDYENDDR